MSEVPIKIRRVMGLQPTTTRLHSRSRSRQNRSLWAGALALLVICLGTVCNTAATATRRPPPPGKLDVRSVSNTSVHLSWVRPQGAARVVGFRVYVDGVLRASVRTTSYRVGGLRCGTSYVLAVGTYDARGRNSQRRSRSVRTTQCVGGCFARPGSCGYPDPAYGNVGVPAGTNLTPSGSITVTTAGAVINGLNVSGSISVRANNVTIQNTKITTSGTGGNAVSASGVSGLTIKNSEISGGNVFDGRSSLSGVYMHNCDNCVLYGTSISDSYLIDDQTNSGSHYEPYYGSGDVIDIEHSVLLNPHSQTAAVFMNGGGSACSNHLTVNNSLLGGGGYTIYPCANSSSAGSSVIKITNNRFARCTTTPLVKTGDGILCSGIGSTNGDVVTKPDGTGYFPYGGRYGLDAYIFCGQTTWSNNVWDDGRSVAC